VLRRLEIRGLVVIEEADLELGPGLTAITGETGAGKTVLTQALALLAGAPADARLVRPGHRHALVQATLAPPSGFWDALEEDDPALALRDLVDDEAEVVVARRIPAEGRARSLVDGQAAQRDAVAALVRRLVRFSGQGEQRRLTAPAAQLAILDGLAGPEAVAGARRLAGLRRELRARERELAAWHERQEAAARRRDELEDLVRAVEEVAPDPAEHAALLAERGRLRHADRLALAVHRAAEALSPGDGDGGAIMAVGAAEAALAEVVDLDPTLAPLLAEVAGHQAGLQEAGLGLRAYLDGLEAQPGRLDAVEARLEAYTRLERRYGPGLEEVLRRAGEASADLGSLREGEAGAEALAAARDAALADARAAADALHALRAAAVPGLESGVAAELRDLAMPDAVFRAELVRDGAEVPKDGVRFLLRVNPGLAEAPLAEAASGGELSRVLLALHGLSAAEGDATWVFDEVDAGIGGVTASAVAARLAALGRQTQTVVITHLPQVAARADAHFRLVKSAGEGGMALTRITAVDGEGLVEELVRMLGAGEADDGARRHARELLARRRA
jgi:DNA repair protein RecN (Recombination protein N)